MKHPASSIPPRRRGPALAAALCCGAAAAGALWQAPEHGRGGIQPPAAEGPVTLASLAADVERVRGLKFKSRPAFQPVDEAELSRRREMPAERAVLLKQAWTAMGFRWEPDWPAAASIAGLLQEQEGAVYDVAGGVFYHDRRDAENVRPEARARLTRVLAAALVQQHFGPVVWDPAADASSARAALLAGDAMRTAALCMLSVPPLPPDVPQREPFYAAPRFLRDLAGFPQSAGAVLGEKLADLNAAWQSPPASSSSILHPERNLAAVPCPAPALNAAPLLTGSLGEYGVQTLLRSQLTKDAVLRGSEQWTADAWALYPGGLAWETRWQTEEGARAFADGLTRTFTQAFGIPDNVVTATAAGSSAEHAARCFSIRIESGRRVLIFSSAAPDFIHAASSVAPSS